MPNLPTSPAELTSVYCTDEDICVVCYADFATLAPKDQIIAAGSDGVFLSSDLWTLNSASVDFNGQGVAVGNIVQIQFGTSKTTPIKMAVAAVNPNQVTLRRVGRAPGWGQPPSPVGGATGVTFTVATFGPQIEYSSYEINGRFGIDPSFALIAPTQIYDLRALQQVTALTVVVKAYRGDTRSTKSDSDFAAKLRSYTQELDDLLARCDMKWNTITGENPQPVTRFNTRCGR